MFNFFKKPERKGSCYLKSSSKYSKLPKDNLGDYDKILADPQFNYDFKLLVKDFFKPYKISLLKFKLNKDYFEDPFPIELSPTDFDHISPSLKLIKEDIFPPSGFPNWFICTFPDVVRWASSHDGRETLKTLFYFFNESQLVGSDQKFKNSTLIKIIDQYLKESNLRLECEVYSN